MAKDKSAGQGNSDASPLLEKLGDDWGDDWETAFQSEGTEGSEDTGEDEAELAEELFLAGEGEEEEEATAGPSPAADAAATAQGRRDPARRMISWLAGRKQLFLSLPGRALTLWRWFQALSTPRKLLTAGGSGLLLLAAVLFFSLSRPPAPMEIVLPDDPFGLRDPQEVADARLFPADAAPAEEPLDPAALLTQPPAADPATMLAPAIATPAATPELPPQPERRRLSLPGFFIPVTGDTDHGDVFLHLDLTLTIQVPPAEEIDPVLQAQLRESIYNFYQDRESATLRRYSLARGDMLRDLRLWLEDHHPDLAADSIAFDRYWIN